MYDSIKSNLPASFDVTPLFSRLDDHEKKIEEGAIQRVKLIELDPYYRHPFGEVPKHEKAQNAKTRLLLAVAFGKHVVVAQLIALELEIVHNYDDQSKEDDVPDLQEEFEWVDVSAERLSHGSREQNGKIGSGGPFVVFPPSCAESLPACFRAQRFDNGIGQERNDVPFTSEITSCALIPSPALTICSEPNSKCEVITQRTVALMLGFSNEHYLLSLLLKVSSTSTNPGMHSMKNNIGFVLEYDECKEICNNLLEEADKKKSDSPNFAKYPLLSQILLDGKRSSMENGASKALFNNHGQIEDFGNDTFHCSNVDENAQALDCTLQSSSSPTNELLPNEKHVVNESSFSVKSICFCRDNKKAASYGTYAATNGEEHQNVIVHLDVVWITYANGFLAKLPSWKLFLKVGPTDYVSAGVLDMVLGAKIVDTASSVVPLTSPARSPLDAPAPAQIIMHQCHHTLSVESKRENYLNLLSSAVCSLQNCTSGQGHDELVQALVIAGLSAPASTPPISFNSSRVEIDLSTPRETAPSSQYGFIQQNGRGSQLQEVMGDHEAGDSPSDGSFDGDHYGPVTGVVVEGTAALVKGALGIALGAVRWGLGGQKSLNEEHSQGKDSNAMIGEFTEIDEDDNESDIPSTHEHVQRTQKQNCDPSAKREVNDSFLSPLANASFPFSDIPRRFETAKVDPSGSLAATTDNLGRIVLFDIDTSQPIRMFKGMRNSKCYFAELPCCGIYNSTRSYLVVHLQQRRAVEVYRMEQGTRVATIAVPREKDCAVVECHGPPSEGNRVNSFLLERLSGTDSNNREFYHYVYDKLVIDDPEAADAVPLANLMKVGLPKSESKKMQLKLLLQLLSPDTNIKCNSQTILVTFKSITLADLGEGLDALSRSNRLESNMGIDGAALHSQAVLHCKSRLNQAKAAASQEGSGIVRKSAISELAMKISYHDRLSDTYHVLCQYESKNLGNNRRDDQEGGATKNLSPWASEALEWISTASENDAHKNRFMLSFSNEPNPNDVKPLEFCQFAMACTNANKDDERVYLTKVKRARLPILRRIFRPLLQDLFVFKIVNSLFVKLGIHTDFDIQQQYFFEWINTLPLCEIVNSNISGTWRPMSRWLRDLILSTYNASQQGQHKLDEAFLKKTVLLESLMKFCMEMENLPKAFLLAVICLEAVSSASIQLEKKTYGIIIQKESIRPWEGFLRKLRVCLLVQLRLRGNTSPNGGVIPMTVSSVSHCDIFSPFTWIALDELSISHDSQVLIAFENACLSSSDAFYPSSAEADNVQHRKTIFQSCRNLHQMCSPHNPGGLKEDTRSCPLLFYLKDHAHFTAHLAAHRALILASLWGQSREHLYLLKNATLALHLVTESIEGFSLAVSVEVYHYIRPVCRALLFGFNEPELSQNEVSPLLENPAWLHEFITLSKRILAMIIECTSKITPMKPVSIESSDMWPPLRECPVLRALVTKLRDVQPSSVEIHHAVLFAFEMTGDINSLECVVPSFADLFLVGALFSGTPLMPKGFKTWCCLVDKALTIRAEKTSSPVVDNFTGIKDIELFAKALGVDATYVRTRYLIEMIRLGKDTNVNDLLGGSSAILDKSTFLEEILQIICCRLNNTMSSLGKSKSYRALLSLLDADASRWVQEEAARCLPSQPNDSYARTSLISTHSLVMRVQMMSENLDNSLSEKINALCLLSGTLLKAVEANKQQL